MIASYSHSLTMSDERPMSVFTISAPAKVQEPVVPGYKCKQPGCQFDAQDGSKYCKKHSWNKGGKA